MVSTNSNISIGFRGGAYGGCSIGIGAETIVSASLAQCYGCESINNGYNSLVIGNGLSNLGSNSFIIHNNLVK